MRHAAAPRREIGVPTSFNFLGPLTNPAQPIAQAIGCADVTDGTGHGEVFAERGASALVFRGDDGLDELTVSTTSSVWRVTEGQVVAGTIDPARLGIAAAPLESLRGGDRAHNAAVVRAVLSGEERGPIRDAVLLNAAAALAAADAAAGGAGTLEDSLASGLQRAKVAVDDGSASAVLTRWVAATIAAAG